jgi:hypothetical protein
VRRAIAQWPPPAVPALIARRSLRWWTRWLEPLQAPAQRQWNFSHGVAHAVAYVHRIVIAAAWYDSYRHAACCKKFCSTVLPRKHDRFGRTTTCPFSSCSLFCRTSSCSTHLLLIIHPLRHHRPTVLEKAARRIPAHKFAPLESGAALGLSRPSAGIQRRRHALHPTENFFCMCLQVLDPPMRSLPQFLALTVLP